MFAAYKRFSDFQGRSNRKEYWLYVLIYFIQLVVALIIDRMVFGAGPAQGFPVVYLLTILANLVPAISIGVRRLHDTNRSGWWLLISFIPIIGAIVYLVFSLLPGTPGSNRFGAQPGVAGLQETFA